MSNNSPPPEESDVSAAVQRKLMRSKAGWIIITAAALCALLFAVWSSFPDSTKERILDSIFASKPKPDDEKKGSSVRTVPSKPEWDAYTFDGRIGEERTLPRTAAIRVRVEGDDSKSDVYVYEPPAGWTILKYEIHEISKINDAGFTPSLTARDPSFASVESIKRVVNEVCDYASSKGKKYSFLKEDASLEKELLEKLMTLPSKNNRLEIKWYAKARTRRVADVVVDRKNASLNVDVTVTIGRMLTDKETDIVTYKLKRAIDENRDPLSIVP